MNRPARFTVAEVRRALKAAEQQGPEWIVEIAPDGTIRILRPSETSRCEQPVVEKIVVL